MPRMNREEAETYAFFMFGKELDHLSAAAVCRNAGNCDDERESMDRADSFLESGWSELEDQGWRHRDIARFRDEAQKAWKKVYPMSIHAALEDAEFLLRKAGQLAGPMRDSFNRSAADARAAIRKAKGE